MQHSFDVSFNFDDENNLVPLIKISIDGEAIGFIQELFIEANSSDLCPSIQMKLIDLSETSTKLATPSLITTIERYKALVNLLAKMPGAHITYTII